MSKDPSANQTYEQLFREYFRPLTVFARRYVSEEGVAEDIVMDLFLYLHEKGDFDISIKGAVNQLYKLVRFRCLNHIEYQQVRKRNLTETRLEMQIPPDDPFELVNAIELENKYLLALEELSPKCREVFEKSRVYGLKNQEIADRLQLSKRTVETHISQALKVMRKMLGEYLRVLLF